MQGPSLFDFWDRLTAVLKVTVLCHARAFFVRFFFTLVLILLWTGKRCDLCLIPTRFHAKKANGGAKGDNALPCKGLLCSIFFFALVLILLWTGKSCGLCLIPTRFHGKKANGGSEGDGALPCKGLLCSIFFSPWF
ncbi:uncharacterized protein LOC114394773 [Glycine soja]|uniref:uncharacterized protein LOC114394773 n=1 Tax=Glycine soja TaxID=3848 RepID=UPI00103DCCF1|nr:uncharacterized protein LOC114394773 [Glycine soja]